MKKLMTMLSAAALAFGLRAAEADTGTSFEGMEAGPLDTASKVGELTPQGDGQSYWSATNENCAATVVEGTSIGRDALIGLKETAYPKQYESAVQEKYLDVKTTFGNPLERKVYADGKGEVLTKASFYIDTLVKFTIFDSEPEFSKYASAKLMAWLQEKLDANDEPTGVTNFCIRAGYANNQTRTYVMDSISDPTAWHRLTVKAIPNIYKDGASAPGFVVFVDNVAMAAVSEGNLDHGIDKSRVAAGYLDFLNRGRLFLSMDQDSDVSTVISAVAFDGQGCVDDLVFTGTQPLDAAADSKEEYVTLTWDAGVSGLSYTIAGDEKVTPEIGKGLALIRYKAGMTITISDVMYAEGYMATAFEATWTPTAANESMVISSSKAAAKFGDTSYATMKEAFDAAAEATASGTLKLFADYDSSDVETEFLNKNCVITLDLAGKTFFGDIGVYDGGSLIIIDTVGGGTVEGLVGADDGTLEIRGGKYKVKEVEEVEGAYLETLNTFATEGKIFELDGGYYVLTLPKVAQIGDDKYVSLAEAVEKAYNGATITMIANTTFDEPLVIAKEVTLDLADAEVKWTGDGGTYPIVISNGVLKIQATTTNEDGVATGAIVKETEAATLIRVGVKGAGTDPEAEDWVAGTAGTLVISGGTFKAAASNVIKVEKGSLTLNGGYVENTSTNPANGRGIRAAKEDGVLESEVTITVNDGTIVAADPLNQEATGHGTITIPGTSTAEFSKDVSTFCEEGYETVLKDGYYVVQKKGSEPEVKPVTPGSSTAYDSEDAAQKAADAINADKSKYITAPEGVEEAYAANYYKAFVATVKVTETGAAVLVDLSPEAVTQIRESVDTEIKKIDVAAVAAADGVSKQTITTVPGLYYSVIAGDTLTGMAVKWCELATGIKKEIPLTKGEGATSGFYKIQATVQEVPVAE